MCGAFGDGCSPSLKTEGKETLFPGSSVASAGAAMLDALFSGTKDVQQSLQLPNRNHPKVSLFLPLSLACALCYWDRIHHSEERASTGEAAADSSRSGLCLACSVPEEAAIVDKDSLWYRAKQGSAPSYISGRILALQQVSVPLPSPTQRLLVSQAFMFCISMSES